MQTIEFNFDDNVVEAFSQGDCWVLARELNRIGDLTMYWAGSKRGNPFFSWCHIFVMHNNGAVIDINGMQNIQDFSTHWRRIAKDWKAIHRSSDFIIRPVTDINAMTIEMRPKYSESMQVTSYATMILDRVNSLV